jgi:hypothetical protein
MTEGEMEITEEFGRYLDHVSEGLGRSERKVCLKDYCAARVGRKSVAPSAV